MSTRINPGDVNPGDDSEVVAGWYQDPQGQPCQRYWDGKQWSEATRPLPAGNHRGAPVEVVLPRTGTNGLAIASFVLSLLFLGGLGSLLGVIFGHVSLGQIKRSAGAEAGGGLAVAGLILGYIGLLSTVVMFLVVWSSS